MVGRTVIERHPYILVAPLLLITLGVVLLVNRPLTTTTNQSGRTQPRETYVAFYDSFWRQDSGQGSILMTSTLLVPPMVTALGQDTQRSPVEEQIWTTMKQLANNQLGMYITFDSISGFLPDAEIQAALQLASDTGTTFGQAIWKPIIGGANQVNANVAVSAQRGVAIFTASEPIDWPRLQQLTLRAVKLGDQPVRQFVWTQVGVASSE